MALLGLARSRWSIRTALALVVGTGGMATRALAQEAQTPEERVRAASVKLLEQIEGEGPLVEDATIYDPFPSDAPALPGADAALLAAEEWSVGDSSVRFRPPVGMKANLASRWGKQVMFAFPRPDIKEANKGVRPTSPQFKSSEQFSVLCAAKGDVKQRRPWLIKTPRGALLIGPTRAAQLANKLFISGADLSGVFGKGAHGTLLHVTVREDNGYTSENWYLEDQTHWVCVSYHGDGVNLARARAVAMTLRRGGPDDPPAVDPLAAETVLAKLNADNGIHAADVLIAHGPSIEPLVLKHSDPKDLGRQGWIVRVLGDIGTTPEALAIINEALSEPRIAFHAKRAQERFLKRNPRPVAPAPASPSPPGSTAGGAPAAPAGRRPAPPPAPPALPNRQARQALEKVLSESKALVSYDGHAVTSLDLSRLASIEKAWTAIASTDTPIRLLTVSDVQLTAERARQIAGMGRVEAIQVRAGSGNAPVSLAAVAQLGKPTRISLAGGRIDDAVLATLAEAPRVERISLLATAVTDEGLGHLKRLPALTSVQINMATRVSGKGLAHLGACPALKELMLEKLPQLDDAAIAGMVPAGALEELSIFGAPKVSAQCLGALRTLPKLKQVRFRGTAVRADVATGATGRPKVIVIPGN